MKKTTASIPVQHCSHFKLKPLAACLRAFITGGVFIGGIPAQAHEPHNLPVEVTSGWTNNHVTEQTIGNTMTITSKDQDVTLHWSSFDVGANATVKFIEPTENSVAINLIGDNQASSILGHISANGEIILINNNGFVFENGSVVDTHGLIASTLNLTEAAITGINNPGTGKALTGVANSNKISSASSSSTNIYAAFTADASGANSDKGSANTVNGEAYIGNKQTDASHIQIDTGAKITSENAKPILMFAPKITNDGTVSSTGGQVIMAAATDVVYLQEAQVQTTCSATATSCTQPPESDVRGLLVEVGTGGNVSNTVNGIISANHGDVTLMGFAVNQSGRVSATSTITENGTIRLLAGEGYYANTSSSANLVLSGPASTTTSDSDGRTSTDNICTQSSDACVVLGAKSVTDISPEGLNTSVVAAQAIAQSRLEVLAGNVKMNGGANVNVPAGIINVTATENPTNPLTGSSSNNSAIEIDSGVNINVAGLFSSASMESNVISVKLQSNELADSPLQKASFLYGTSVQVDTRADNGKGSSLANLSSDIANRTFTYQERLLNAGSINLQSEGSITVNDKAEINFYGGGIDYAAGYIDTTILVANNGQLVNIGTANPLLTYTGIYGSATYNDPKWGDNQTFTFNGGGGGVYEAAYTQGGNAGSLSIDAANVIMHGDLHAQATDGIKQRDIADQAAGGTLTISNNYATNIQDIVFSNTPDVQLNNQNNIGYATVLAADIFKTSGIKTATFNSFGAIRILADVNVQLTANSTTNFNADLIDVAGTLEGAGASLNLKTSNDANSSSYDQSITLENAAQINLQGAYINDYVNTQNAANAVLENINGGSFTATANGNLSLAANSQVNVNGGAWIADNRSINAGTAGNISLAAASSQHNGSNLSIQGANLLAYGIKNNGTITLESNQIKVGDTDPAQLASKSSPLFDNIPETSSNLNTLWVSDNFLSAGGFSKYTLISDINGLTVASDANVNLEQQNLILDNNYVAVGNTSQINFSQNTADQKNTDFATITALPDYTRAASALSLIANQNTGPNSASVLSLADGSKINADPQSNISLSSDSSIYLDGKITDHAGTVTLSNFESKIASESQPTYIPNQAIWLGKDSVIDVSGTFIQQPNTLGLLQGQVLDGGTVNLTANFGFVATQTGSTINISGTQQQETLPVTTANNQLTYSAQTIGSNGGKLNVIAAEGAYLDGTMQAQAGDAKGVLGGSLSLTLQQALGANQQHPVIAIVQDITQDDLQGSDGNYYAADVLNTNNNFSQFNDTQPSALNTMAVLGATQITTAGFSSLSLHTIPNSANNSLATGEIIFQGTCTTNCNNTADNTINLSLTNALTLDTPQIAWALENSLTKQDLTQQAQGSVNLTVPNLTLGYSKFTPEILGAIPGLVSTGKGELNVNQDAHQQQGIIILQGAASTSGFDAVNLTAASDIQLQGELDRTYNDTAFNNSNGQPTPDSFQGQFNTSDQLTLTADRIYATTLSQFNLTATNTATGSITFAANSNTTPTPVLEADANLTVTATNIHQNGHLLMPLGKIDFEATNIAFGANSITSVSGQNQIIPFGITSAGQDWLYPINDSNQIGQFNLIFGGTQASALSTPQKHLTLNAKTVSADSSAKIDLSGGGDVMAYEFVPGSGGSKDVLLPDNAVGGGTSYAIIKDYAGYAPYDPLQSSAAGLSLGEQITIGAGSDLPAGTYTLLPAHYALLPNAYLVTPQTTTSVVPQGFTSTRVDGAHIVSGYYDIAGTSSKSQALTEFVVQPGSAVNAYSQYTISYGDKFFASQAATDKKAVPLLAEDAGQLSASVTTALALPTLITKADTATNKNAKAAVLEISANKISVVATANDIPSSPDPTLVYLTATELNQNLGSLLLGGTRTTDSSTGNPELNVSATNVSIASQVSLTAGEILLTGTGQQNTDNTITAGVEVGQGASLIAENTAPTPTTTILETSGDSAVLRIANGEQISLQRNGIQGQVGDLLIDKNAQLVAGNSAVAGSILLDSTGNNSSMQGNINLDSHNALPGNLSVAAKGLSLGDTDAQTGLVGMALDNTLLNALGNLAALNLDGRNFIDFYGQLTTPTLTNLVLNSPRLVDMSVNNQATSTTTLNTTSLLLKNDNAACASGLSGCVATGSDNFVINTANFGFADTETGTKNASLDWAGFSNIQITANKQITGTGLGVFNFNADTHIHTGAISGTSAANTTLNNAANALTIDNQLSTNTATHNQAGVGASLNINAKTLNLDTQLLYHAGNVNLQSTSTTDTLSLGANALIDVSATQVAAGLNSATQLAAGEISLISGQNIFADADSQLLLSSSYAAVSAGKLTVSAQNGTAAMTGHIHAYAADKQHAGQLSFDLNNLGTGGFDALNKIAIDSSDQSINAVNKNFGLGGFYIRLHNGDLSVDQNVTAYAINFAADNGTIDVSSTLDASGPNGGSIDLASNQGITLESTANLDASTSADTHTATGNGGHVKLTALNAISADNTGLSFTPAFIHMQTGAVIDVTSKGDYTQLNCVSLSSCGSIGKVEFDVDRQALTTANDIILNGTINITPHNTGAGTAGYDPTQSLAAGQQYLTLPEIVAIQVYNLSNTDPTAGFVSDTLNTITANDISTFNTDASNFMAGYTGSSQYLVLPGVEAITTQGQSLTLNTAWNLSSWRYQYNNGNSTETVPGELILRSSGALNIDQTISDGFTLLVKTGRGAYSIEELQAGYSWGYQLIAGADLAAANQSVTQTGTSGNDLTLAAASQIRTGTGDIDIQAAGNILMSDNSKIYTAGSQVATDPWGITLAQAIAKYKLNPSLFAEYPVAGGNISLNSGGNIAVTPVNSLDTLTLATDWLDRSLNTIVTEINNIPTITYTASWGINFANYNQSIGALGGGNVNINATDNISSLTVVLPTTSKYDPTTNVTTLAGGGNLEVSAGGDIQGGAYYVQQGTGSITAKDSLTTASYNNVNLAPILALGDAQIAVVAGQNIELSTILNPTVTPSNNYANLFFTYTANSGVSLIALAGDVTLENSISNITTATDFLSNASNELVVYPGSLDIAALQGSLNILNSFYLYPSASGNLQLFAYNNIDTGTEKNDTAVNVYQSAADPAVLPSISQPLTANLFDAATTDVLTNQNSINAYAETPLHSNDLNPVLLSTGIGSLESQNTTLTIVLPKQLTANIAKNIVNTGFMIQNDTADSKSLLYAGGNISFSTVRDSGTGALVSNAITPGQIQTQAIQVSGPGQLTVLSAGSIDLGSSGGILSYGNTGPNSYLPSGGANLTVAAGINNTNLGNSWIANNLMQDNAASTTFNNLFAADYKSALAKFSSAPTTQNLIDLVSTTESTALAGLAKTTPITFGYKEYFTQYMQDYWNHYAGNLAVDGFLTLLNQAETAALTANSSLTDREQIAANAYAEFLNSNMLTALNAYTGSLTIATAENMLQQAENSAWASINNQFVSSTDNSALSSIEIADIQTNYISSLNTQIQTYWTGYTGNQFVDTAVAGVLTAEAVTAAKTTFDQQYSDYQTAYNQLTAQNTDQSIINMQLLPYVQSVYASDEKQFAQQRAAAVLTKDKDSLELAMLATTEQLFPGTTLLSPTLVSSNTLLSSSLVSNNTLFPAANTQDYNFDLYKGWSANSDTTATNLMKNVDINLLDLIATQYGGTSFTLPDGTAVDINADIASINAANNSGVGKDILSALYNADSSLQGKIRTDLGDISLFFSTIQTYNGGNINLLTPSGGIDAGLSATTVGQKAADQLGIIVRAAGDINAFLRNDFQVNLTRVMTLGGGDVVAGSSEGSLDAGKGVALNGAVQTGVAYDIYGNPIVSLLPAVSTSGIRSASPSGSNVKAGTIVLFAPRGVIDAGEAGIAGGSLFLDASSFKNTANISSSTGVSVGAPTPPPVGISASISGASGLSASVNKSFESSTDVAKDTADERMKASTTLGILTVDLLGFGD